MFNIGHLSLMTGVVPISFKSAVVKPLLKKPHLDPGSLNNHTPASKLPYFSKVLERVVLQQHSGYLLNNNLLKSFQSVFRACHSTGTALTKVVNDIPLTYLQNSTSLLQDLSAAFDTLDHGIFLGRLQSQFGISGLALA